MSSAAHMGGGDGGGGQWLKLKSKSSVMGFSFRSKGCCFSLTGRSHKDNASSSSSSSSSSCLSCSSPWMVVAMSSSQSEFKFFVAMY